MNFKNQARIISCALTMFIMTPTYGQHVPKSKNSAKRILIRAATASKEQIDLAADASKRSIKETVEKFSLTNRDLIQGSIIGSTLLGASFLVNDPKLQWMLRIAAVAPMLAGVFMPKKWIQKINKLELDEAKCSNPTCKGVCASCRVTKAYIATIPVTLIFYGIAWMFTKHPTALTPLTEIPSPELPSERTQTPHAPTPAPENQSEVPGPQTPETTPKAQNPEEAPEFANESPEKSVNEPVKNYENEGLLYVRAREAENGPEIAPQNVVIPPKEKEELVVEDTADLAAAYNEWKAAPKGTPVPPILSQGLIEAANRVAEEIGLRDSSSDEEMIPVEAHAQEESSEEQSGWGSWLGNKVTGWFMPDVDYDYYDNN